MDSNFDQKLSKLIVVGGVMIFSTIITISLFQGNENYKKLKTDFKITKARIIKFEEAVYKSSFPNIYSFYIGEEKITGELESGVFCKVLEDSDKKFLREVEFDLIYYPPEPKINRIIYSQEMYREFKLDYPANNSELGSVLDEYFKCKWSLWRWVN